MADDQRQDLVAQDARDLRDRIASCKADLRFVLKQFQTTGSPPGLAHELAKISTALQDLNEEAAQIPDELTGSVASLPPEETDAARPAKSKNTKPDRKMANLANFLILFVVWHHQARPEAVSQDTLFELLCKFDPSWAARRPSFISKLSDLRRKNPFLEWDETEDLRPAEGCKKRVEKLHGIVMKDPEFESLRNVIRDHFGTDPDFATLLGSGAV